MKLTIKVLPGITALISLSACAQAPTAKPRIAGAEYYALYQKAQGHASNKQYAEAVAIYTRLTAAYPDDAEIWLALGQARAAQKQYREAAEAYSQSIARGGTYNGFIAARIAKLYAQAGDKKKALEWIEKANAIPLENRPGLANDEVFAAWRDDEQFRKLAGLLPKREFTREQGWNHDLDFLVSEVRRMDYSFHTGPLPKGFEESVATLRKRIPQLSDDLMKAEIQRLMAMLGDGHTGMREMSRHIGVMFYEFSDGMFVIDGPADCDCIGERVTALGSTPVETAMRLMAPFVSTDNAMGIRALGPIYLRSPDYLQLAGVLTGDEVPLSLEDKTGRKRTYVAKVIEGHGGPPFLVFPSKLAGAGPAPRYLQHPMDPFWFETLPGGETVYLQFNAVRDKPDETITQFAKRLRKAIASPQIRNLIIDIRLNGGGNLNLFPALLRTISGFEASREDAGIYVITGRLTFSAAQVFLNELDHHTSATIAGEPSRSKPNFVGESAPTVLPFSGVHLTISTRYHQTDDQDNREWIAPKIPVTLSSADYFANRDPVLDAVLAVIKAGKKN